MHYIEDVIQTMTDKTVVFWGAGRRMRGFLQKFCIDNKILPMPNYVCDSTRVIGESTISGVPVIDFEEVKKMNYSNTIIVMTAGLFDLQAQVITNELYYFPIYHCRAFETYFYLKENQERLDLVLARLADDKSREIYRTLFESFANGTFWCQSLFEPNAYFDNQLTGRLKDGETFAFAGAFNGKHIDRALASNKNIRVHAFEPNKQWYDYLIDKYAGLSNVNIHNNGLWSERAHLKFDGDSLNSGLDAHVVTAEYGTSSDVISSVDLDSVVQEKVSLIALDVEGSEAQALKGARKTIEKYRPRLAVCLYHNIEDFIELPLLIDELTGGDYKFFVKQHSCITAIETVLYAL